MIGWKVNIFKFLLIILIMAKREACVSIIRYVPDLETVKSKVKRDKKKIYVKEVWKLSDFIVWIVNGDFIRRNICEDFVNFGQHYHFKFIPKKEIWLDRELVPGEIEFYIEHLLVENRLMAKGIAYEEAYKRAKIAEKEERHRSVIGRELKKDAKNGKLLSKIHKKLWKSYSGKVKIWIVSGELVRDFYDINFGGGTHDKVDKFVPKNEIWIDDDVLPKERKFMLVHELHERRLMGKKGLSYLSAHKLATELEDYCRHYPKRVEKEIKDRKSVV